MWLECFTGGTLETALVIHIHLHIQVQVRIRFVIIANLCVIVRVVLCTVIPINGLGWFYEILTQWILCPWTHASLHPLCQFQLG